MWNCYLFNLIPSYTKVCSSFFTPKEKPVFNRFPFTGEVNQGYANDGHRSRRSSTNTISGHSVAMFPHPNEVHDRMSEYGTPHRAGHRSMNKPPSSHSYRPEYSSSANQHRFHLWGSKTKTQQTLHRLLFLSALEKKKHSTILHTTTIYSLYSQKQHTTDLFDLSIWMYYVYINNFLLFLFIPNCI
jgi:hypothetical protein